MRLDQLLRLRKQIRVIGFDDACFDRVNDKEAGLCGIVCSNTRFEGMLWGAITVDGTDVNSRLTRMLLESKYRDQIHVILLDGITFGGMNMINIRQLHEETGVPCVSVMRKLPDLRAFSRVIDRFEGADGSRRRAVQDAGPAHELGGFVFQTIGAEPEVVAETLKVLTDQGKVPEALRLAHLIGTAVKTGQSGKRA